MGQTSSQEQEEIILEKEVGSRHPMPAKQVCGVSCRRIGRYARQRERGEDGGKVPSTPRFPLIQRI